MCQGALQRKIPIKENGLWMRLMYWVWQPGREKEEWDGESNTLIAWVWLWTRTQQSCSSQSWEQHPLNKSTGKKGRKPPKNSSKQWGKGEEEENPFLLPLPAGKRDETQAPGRCYTWDVFNQLIMSQVGTQLHIQTINGTIKQEISHKAITQMCEITLWLVPIAP